MHPLLELKSVGKSVDYTQGKMVYKCLFTWLIQSDFTIGIEPYTSSLFRAEKVLLSPSHSNFVYLNYYGN